jgi:hypothetical protein
LVITASKGPKDAEFRLKLQTNSFYNRYSSPFGIPVAKGPDLETEPMTVSGD